VTVPADDLDPLRAYWDERARSAASDCERIESGRRGQRLRFEAFLQHHLVAGRSVLDVGCGVGDFYERLQQRVIDADYHGIDLSTDMVARARQRFPGARFEVADISQLAAGTAFDYTTAFAIHNIKVDNGLAMLERVMRQQFALSRVMAYVSLLTDRYQGFSPHLQAWRAEEILTLALSISPYVALRHDYLPNDFSVAIYRQPLIDSVPGLTADLA